MMRGFDITDERERKHVTSECGIEQDARKLDPA